MVGDDMKEDELIFCPRCGEKMRKGQRNCLKCGQLNYENPSNEYMKKYESKHGSNLNDGTYIIGKGTVRKPSKLSIFSNSRPNEILANNAGNLTFCALFNIFSISFLFFLAIGLYNKDFTTAPTPASTITIYVKN